MYDIYENEKAEIASSLAALKASKTQLETMYHPANEVRLMQETYSRAKDFAAQGYYQKAMGEIEGYQSALATRKSQEIAAQAAYNTSTQIAQKQEQIKVQQEEQALHSHVTQMAQQFKSQGDEVAAKEVVQNYETGKRLRGYWATGQPFGNYNSLKSA